MGVGNLKRQFTQDGEGRQNFRPQINADLRWSNRINPKGSHGFSRIDTDNPKHQQQIPHR